MDTDLVIYSDDMLDINETLNFIRENDTLGLIQEYLLRALLRKERKPDNFLLVNFGASILFLITVITIFFLVLSIVFIFKNKLREKNPIYRVLVHFFTFKIFLSVLIFLSVNSSNIVQNSIFHIKRDHFGCFFLNLTILFFDIGEHLQFLIIWLIIFAERDFLKFKFLYSDYLVKKVATSMEEEVGQSDQVAETNSDRAYVQKLKKKSIKNFLILKSRSIILIGFYILNAILAFFLSIHTSPIYYEKHKFCVFSSMNSYVFLIYEFLVMIVLFPITYFFLLVSTFFSVFFAGKKDELTPRQTESENSLIVFVKKASFLIGVEELLMTFEYTTFWIAHPFLIEILRSVCLLTILATVILFVKKEGVHLMFNKNAQVNNDRNFNTIFRPRNSNTEIVDYQNLVENGY
ncbi:hypothetical protein BpHYR1_039202 [Brachionus plicatilis]|uniref:Uncharacterized protein n=1 Tax=Brachionus plicatilis TaxID=10195 RepID=A0A3M7QVS2_BRAPC|nr:hypothetical protein BpHYR1_039202 [Brachionus plicatilis]